MKMTAGVFLLQIFYRLNKINHFRKVYDELTVRYFIRVVYPFKCKVQDSKCNNLHFESCTLMTRPVKVLGLVVSIIFFRLS
jgi:hypothetical protein